MSSEDGPAAYDLSPAEVVRKAIRAGSSFYGALTREDAQRGVNALLAAGWTPPYTHHEGTWSVNPETGECGCECPRCYVDACCVCPDCTYDHDHSCRVSDDA